MLAASVSNVAVLAFVSVSALLRGITAEDIQAAAPSDATLPQRQGNLPLFDSFYVDVAAASPWLKDLIIPTKKGDCNLFLQFLNASEARTSIGTSVVHAFPACSVASAAPARLHTKTGRMQDIESRYGGTFLLLEDLKERGDGTKLVEAGKISVIHRKRDAQGRLLNPHQAEKLEFHGLTGYQYDSGPSILQADLMRWYPDPRKISIGELSPTGLPMEETHFSKGWSPDFGVFVYPIPPIESAPASEPV